MTQLELMDLPVTLKMTQGDLDILIGLITARWSDIKHQVQSGNEDRRSYCETLFRLRQELIARSK